MKRKLCEKDKRKALKRLLAAVAAEFALAAFLVWFFDPFYQYHMPFFGMETVLNDRDNQMPGTVRNFSYDSALVGSSVAENFDSSWLDGKYGCTTLKIIRASGSIADLLYYLEQAQERQELKYVFWTLDITAVASPLEVSLNRDTAPWYLHTETVLDDLPYVYNKEILLEKIPSMLAYAHEGINTGGQAYNWARGKVFSAAQAMRAYDRSSIVLEGEPEEVDFTGSLDVIHGNVELLTDQVAAHPDTVYRFLVPPLSMMWWDCAYVNGQLEERFYILNQAVSALLPFENVEVYYFQNEDWIVCNLDNYMDMVHYAPEINQYMLERMGAGENRVTEENWEDTLEELRRLAERISREEIFRYYQ